MVTHAPTSDVATQQVLECLRKISPRLTELKVDSSNINKYPELAKVVKNHSRGSAYMRQFFKKPLVDNCDCVCCNTGMFRPLIMPEEAYKI